MEELRLHPHSCLFQDLKGTVVNWKCHSFFLNGGSLKITVPFGQITERSLHHDISSFFPKYWAVLVFDIRVRSWFPQYWAVLVFYILVRSWFPQILSSLSRLGLWHSSQKLVSPNIEQSWSLTFVSDAGLPKYWAVLVFDIRVRSWFSQILSSLGLWHSCQTLVSPNIEQSWSLTFESDVGFSKYWAVLVFDIRVRSWFPQILSSLGLWHSCQKLVSCHFKQVNPRTNFLIFFLFCFYSRGKLVISF